MIVWRGLGILVVITVMAVLIAAQLITDALFGGGTYARSSNWIVPAGLLLSAAIIWPLGRALNRRPARTLIDQQTGQRVSLRADHSLFFIRMEYWAALLAGGALVLFVLAVTG